ncbi:hypothetical protein GCM10028833_10130 [Glycomyces tarimensis]
MLGIASAAIALAVSGCGGDAGPAESELDLSAPGYVQAGVEFWEGWKVPEGTVLLGTPFPRPDLEYEGMPENNDVVGAEFLVTGDAHDVLRDLYAQMTDKGLRPVVREDERSVCAQSESRYDCSLFGRAEDGFAKIETRLEVDERPEEQEPYPRLRVELGAFSWFDIVPDLADDPLYEDMSEEEIREQEEQLRTRWADAEAPEGDAPVSTPAIDAGELVPGAELPFFGKDESIGAVPEGSRLLAPPYNPSATYGFAGIFSVEEDTAFGELEEMAAESATGERFPDEELVSGDLVAHRISYDGSAGGCSVELDVIDARSEARIARLDIVCD